MSEYVGLLLLLLLLLLLCLSKASRLQLQDDVQGWSEVFQLENGLRVEDARAWLVDDLTVSSSPGPSHQAER